MHCHQRLELPSVQLLAGRLVEPHRPVAVDTRTGFPSALRQQVGRSSKAYQGGRSPWQAHPFLRPKPYDVARRAQLQP